MGSSSSNRPCSPDSPLTTVAAMNAGTLPEAFATVPATGRLLLLVPTKSYRIGDFLNAATRLGVSVAVGSNLKHVLEEFSDGGTVTIDFSDLKRGVSQIIDYAGTYPLNAIIGVDDETTVLAATASQELGLAHNDPEAVQATRNKYRFRTRLANSGLAQPRFRLCSLEEDPEKTATDVSYPVVLKPLTLSASRGVIRADNAAQFKAAHRRIRAILEKADILEPEAANHILVEEYLPGGEVALEGILEDGNLTVLALFDKPDPLEGPYFEETIYVTPSRLPADIQDAITDTVTRAVAHIGLREGPIHAEMRINDNGVWLIEVATRSIGGHCARVLDFGEAGQLEDLILRHALNMPFITVEQARTASGVMMIPIPKAGRLCQVDGLEAARTISGIKDVIISIPVSEILVPVPDGHKYLGFIFARNDTPEDVIAALRQAHAQLKFLVEPLANSMLNEQLAET